MNSLLHIFLTFFPWKIRRPLLERFFGYQLHPTSHIGFSLFMPKHLILHAQAQIGHLTVCKNLDWVELGEKSSVGRLNWISAYPTSDKTNFSTERKTELIVGEHGHITHRHIIDCTSAVHVGRYTVVGGYRSQILTHAVDLAANRQDSKPISIGEFSFVSSGVILLGGSVLPANSLLAAGAVLNKAYQQTYQLYAGVPARPVKTLEQSIKYFSVEERLISDS